MRKLSFDCRAIKNICSVKQDVVAADAAIIYDTKKPNASEFMKNILKRRLHRKKPFMVYGDAQQSAAV